MDGLTWPKDLSIEGMNRWNLDFEDKAMKMSGRIDTQTTVTIRYFANNWKTLSGEELKEMPAHLYMWSTKVVAEFWVMFDNAKSRVPTFHFEVTSWKTQRNLTLETIFLGEILQRFYKEVTSDCNATHATKLSHLQRLGYTTDAEMGPFLQKWKQLSKEVRDYTNVPVNDLLVMLREKLPQGNWELKTEQVKWDKDRRKLDWSPQQAYDELIDIMESHCKYECQ